MSDSNKGKNKLLIIIIILLIIIIVGGGIFFILSQRDKGDDSKEPEPTATVSGPKIGYETNVITSNKDDLQEAVDEMLKKAKEGNIALEFKNIATSSDGENFSCYLANSEQNNYDCYYALYEDAKYEKELFLTGLIPVGSAIDNFKINKKLDKGTYDMVLVLTQVEDDHETIHGQVSFTLTLSVN